MAGKIQQKESPCKRKGHGFMYPAPSSGTKPVFAEFAKCTVRKATLGQAKAFLVTFFAKKVTAPRHERYKKLLRQQPTAQFLCG